AGGRAGRARGEVVLDEKVDGALDAEGEEGEHEEDDRRLHDADAALAREAIGLHSPLVSPLEMAVLLLLRLKMPGEALSGPVAVLGSVVAGNVVGGRVVGGIVVGGMVIGRVVGGMVIGSVVGGIVIGRVVGGMVIGSVVGTVI